MTDHQHRSQGMRAKVKRLVAVFLASMLALAGVASVAPAAYASSTPGISVTTLHDGDPISDGGVVQPGESFTLRVQYNQNEPFDASQPVVVGPPEGVTFDHLSLDVSGNEAIESATLDDDGNIQLNFHDPDDWGVNQGIWDLDFVFDEVDFSESKTIEWTIDGEPTSIEVIVITEDADREDVENQLSKSLQDLSLNDYLSVNQGNVAISESILDETFQYTLTVNSDRDTERSGFTIEDQISPYLAYDEESFEANIKTWDEIGWNSDTNPFPFEPEVSGNSFTYSGDIPNPSQLTVDYTASIPEGQLEALTTALQEEFNALGGAGDYAVSLNNEVTFGDDGTTDDANVDITGNRSDEDGPHEVTDHLEKSADNRYLDDFVSFDESGQVVLEEAIEDHVIAYTLTVNTASEEGRDGFDFVDQLSPYMEYNKDSFVANITTWDESGWNPETQPFDFEPDFSGDGFTYRSDIDGPSELTITYNASVANGQLDALRDALQTEFDDLDRASGDYRVSLNNTITFGEGEEGHQANVSVGNHRADGEGPENVSGYLNKGVGNPDLSQYVDVYEDTVSVDEDILELTIDYTLDVNTDRNTERDDYTIEDEISEFLTYDQDSFVANITTWNEGGWDQETNSFDYGIDFSDNSFIITGDIESPSELTINYSASVAEDQLDALTEALQAEFDALEAGWGEFDMELPNTAIFDEDDDDPHEGSVTIGGELDEPPVPSVGEAFDKSSDIDSTHITPSEDGVLDPALDVTYTFGADLSQWDRTPANGYLNEDDFTLDRNVVISDSLPPQASWNTGVDDFIAADGIELTEVAGFNGDATAFEADEYVGHYAVVEQDLYINIGQDQETEATINVSAQINSIEGLASRTNDPGFTIYEVNNEAEFDYSIEEDPYTDSAQIDLVDTQGGVDFPQAFSKNGPDSDGPVYSQSGETSVTLPYTFVVNDSGNETVDVTNSHIVDYRDSSLFDFSDLEEIQSNISGEYAHWHELGPEYFALSLTDDGNLRIELSESGVELVGDDVESRLQINMPLTTVDLGARQTVTVENNAMLYGSDDHALYWSETTSEASSYGGEAEVRKSIRDTDSAEWTQNLRVEIDEDDELVQDEYVYNLAFIPHDYENVPIVPVVDELPEEIEFRGFVTDDNVDTRENAASGPFDIGGNLEAVYDADAHSVTVQQQDGTLLNQEPNISANVLVQVTEFQRDTPVANWFGNSSSTFTPSDGYPLSIAKVDSEDDEVVISDPDSRFDVYDEGENLVVEDAFADEGFLRVLNEDGDTSGVVVSEPGTYYVEETVAPEGYELSTDRIEVTVGEDGSSDQVTFPNVPADEPPTPELEVDKNEPGDDVHQVEAGEHNVEVTITNSGEDALQDFVFEDTTESGEDVVWDEDDLAALDELVLEPGDSFTVNGVVQVAAGETHRDNVVINADGVISGQPVEDEDPTTYEADADPTYAIGDYVWIDDNRDGVQGSDEDPLGDVTVVLYDGAGEEVSSTTTGEDGRYLFDELPAGEYQVQFVLTEGQEELYEFTSYTSGDDSTGDSNAGEDGFSSTIVLGPDNEFLTSDEEYDHNTVNASEGIDPTWDAGVVVTLVPELGVAKNEPGDDVHQVEAGEHNVEVTITNSGEDALQDFVFEDTTESGEDVVWDEDDLAALDELVLEPGDSFTVNGVVQVAAGETHRDNVVINADGVISGQPVEDEDPTTYEADADPTYAIGDYVWIDSNSDGVQGSDEDPLGDVTVELYTVDDEGNASSEPMNTTTTDEVGRYIFDELPSGEYQVRFILTEEQAELYEFTSYTEGDDTVVDSDAGEDGRSGVIVLNDDNEFLTSDEDYDHNTVNASEGIDPTWDAGVVLLPEPAEPAVEIIKGDGDAEAGTIENDANTEDDAIDYAEGETRDVVINVTNTGEEDLVDVVLTDETLSGAAVEGLVWTTPGGTEIAAEDVDGVLTATWEGPWAPGEVITGVASLTLAEGEELHTNLASVTATGAASGTPVQDDDPYNGTPPEVEPEEPTYAIGDYVWIDDNRDGVQGSDEDPLEGVTVVLYDGEGEEVSSTTTDEDGRYLFDELPAGEYQVQFVLTEEQEELYEFTSYTSGDDSTGDSNAGEDGFSSTIVLGPDNEFLTSDEDYDHNAVNASEGIDPTWDAGVVLIEGPEETPKPTDPDEPTYAIGDYVWIDSNNDGVQDEDEGPLPGVTVILRDGEGSEVGRTTTDEDGRYIFDELPAGDYQVQFALTEEQTELYGFTSKHSADDAAADSDANPGTGLTPVFSLGEESPGLTQDYDRDFLATDGIDPTWDAGVVLIEDAQVTPPSPVDPTDPPADSEDPEPSPTPTDPATSPDAEEPDSEDEEDSSLAQTGATVAGVLVASVMLLLGGLLLWQWNGRRRSAEF